MSKVKFITPDDLSSEERREEKEKNPLFFWNYEEKWSYVSLGTCGNVAIGYYASHTNTTGSFSWWHGI